ncbi:AAC(3) family N-acetyltransferase [Paenibacillus sp. OSY-SE]|uniref:AAC(3) family N-acetyltransferase n=1 Tax=Paenibacillus sp. OSY-SE TaxID=1196323 RepID=UPI00031F3D11|nr:AAC(3) family N-acetyltransferase [Paenibacillus sp. OSY-SE]
MKKFTNEDFLQALIAANVYPGDMVFVHSSLFQFGRMEGCQPQEIPAQLVRLLLDYLGSEGTIAVPTFNFGFIQGLPYNRQQSSSEGMGVFSETVRQLPGGIRSCHPLQSIAAVGRLAETITTPDTSSSFDTNGPFGIMVSLGAKVLLLGASIQAASLIHYVEERLEVPYRQWKTVSGIYVNNGEETKRTYKFFARDLELDPRLNLDPIETWLTERNQFYKVPVGNGHVSQFAFSDFVDVVTEHLMDNPYCLITSMKTNR